MNSPSIAACLIVRDQGDFLANCLASLENAADSIYVTDTGSVDDSVDVARSFGAVVRAFPWQDDFAAARNASIAEIKEDWILLLDADDLFPVGEAAKLRSMLDPEACAATLCYSVMANYTPVRAVRLVRNHAGARFEGIIHENLDAWLATQRADGKQQQELEISLIHTGYSANAMAGKVIRNLPLLEAEWGHARNGNSLNRQNFIAAELGLALAHAGRREEAQTFLRNRLNEVIVHRENAGTALQLLINLLWVFGETKQQSDALATVRACEESLGTFPVYQLHRGLTEFASTNFQEAQRWFDSFRRLHDLTNLNVPIPREYLGVGLWRMIGLCQMGNKDYTAAAESFRQCAELDPGNEEHQLRLLVARRMMSE